MTSELNRFVELVNGTHRPSKRATLDTSDELIMKSPIFFTAKERQSVYLSLWIDLNSQNMLWKSWKAIAASGCTVQTRFYVRQWLKVFEASFLDDPRPVKRRKHDNDQLFNRDRATVLYNSTPPQSEILVRKAPTKPFQETNLWHGMYQDWKMWVKRQKPERVQVVTALDEDDPESQAALVTANRACTVIRDEMAEMKKGVDARATAKEDRQKAFNVYITGMKELINAVTRVDDHPLQSYFSNEKLNYLVGRAADKIHLIMADLKKLASNTKVTDLAKVTEITKQFEPADHPIDPPSFIALLNDYGKLSEANTLYEDMERMYKHIQNQLEDFETERDHPLLKSSAPSAQYVQQLVRDNKQALDENWVVATKKLQSYSIGLIRPESIKDIAETLEVAMVDQMVNRELALVFKQINPKDWASVVRLFDKAELTRSSSRTVIQELYDKESVAHANAKKQFNDLIDQDSVVSEELAFGGNFEQDGQPSWLSQIEKWRNSADTGIEILVELHNQSQKKFIKGSLIKNRDWLRGKIPSEWIEQVFDSVVVDDNDPRNSVFDRIHTAVADQYSGGVEANDFIKAVLLQYEAELNRHSSNSL